ncbi:MAG: PTS transporter subunit EIIC [Clostridiales bacterium]|jgi:PTS system beta-glucosides-specific IIC component|nr:PTS transporter subunit EIIC [Clostridiales bacterium]
MAIDKRKLAQDIIDHVGGVDNITNIWHCATRLRFNLKDEKKCNLDEAKKIYGVITAINKQGVYQFVVGQIVPDVYRQAIVIVSKNSDTASNPTDAANRNEFAVESQTKQSFSVEIFWKILKSLPQRFIKTVSGVFPPVIMLIAAGGVLLGLRQILLLAGAMQEGGDTDIVFSTLGFAPLNFMPILLGFSAGRHFGGSPYLCGLIGATIMHPTFVSLAETDISFVGINLHVLNYTGSVIPILLSAYLAVVLEKLFMKYMHQTFRAFAAPTLVLLIVVPLTLWIIGPILTGAANALVEGYGAIPPWLSGLMIGALWQVLVIFGLHHAFSPIDLTNLATKGFSNFGAITQVAAMSQTGAAFGMMLRMKDKGAKGMAITAVATGVCGVTEPIIYGLTLPRKMPFVYGVVGGAVGGLVAGLMGAGIYRSGAWGLLGLPSTISDEGIGRAFWGSIVGLVVSFVVAAALVYLTYKDDTVKHTTKVVEDNGQQLDLIQA